MADFEMKEAVNVREDGKLPANVTESDRQIEGYHKALHALFKGCDEIITAQACASFMGCLMAHSEIWERLVPGYVNETLQYANLAMAAHRLANSIAQPDLNQPGEAHGSEEAKG